MIENTHYYTHVEEKSCLRCLLLLVPVLGNIVVGLYDFANGVYQDKDSMLVALHTFGSYVFTFASPELQNDKEFALAAVKRNGLRLQSASKALRNDPDVVLAAVEQNGLALAFASDSLKDVRKIVLAAFYNNAGAKNDASPQLQKILDTIEQIRKPGGDSLFKSAGPEIRKYQSRVSG